MKFLYKTDALELDKRGKHIEITGFHEFQECFMLTKLLIRIEWLNIGTYFKYRDARFIGIRSVRGEMSQGIRLLTHGMTLLIVIQITPRILKKLNLQTTYHLSLPQIIYFV